jgi:hypothetical protein
MAIVGAVLIAHAAGTAASSRGRRKKEDHMVQATRPFLQDPLLDEELEPIDPATGGVEDLDLSKTGLTKDYLGQSGALKETRQPGQWKNWGSDEFGSASVGEYVSKLAAEQRELLKIGLLHAHEPAHGGRVTFRKRSTVYSGGWGLEVIDKGGTEGPEVFPLVIVFVEPPQP